MNLYSRKKILASLGPVILVLLVFALTLAGNAQRRKPHKLRATAVLEVTTDPAGVVSTRVFPVTILDDGNFQDASTYKSAPRPMALDNGIVYEAQKSGVPQGYVTIVNGVERNDAWRAFGKWQSITAAKKTETVAPKVNTGDDRPILHHGDAGTNASASTPAPTSNPQEAQVQTSSSSSSQDDSDRPILRRHTSENSEAAASPSPSPAASATPASGKVPETRLAVIPAGTRTFVGISDNQPSDSRSFDFIWKPGEEQQMEAKMRKLVLAQLPHENAQLTPQDSLKNVTMRSFDLDLSNDAVLVMSAEVPGSYLAAGAKGSSGKFISRYVTVIARVDFDGVPQKLSSSVTDSSRLDVAPRLELIDAVDVDGDGLGELLFREYSFDNASFIIYGVGRNSVTKVFEGASTPLNEP
ncbi:MAG TPA: hypothetical protein VJW20_22935 [Candidatus Angelobacter sp.]|nr:hypothetical protein [Candidatus Angelobacter sp.]